MFELNTKKIVFIRHGESEYNRDNKFYGWHNPDLTDLGRSQAERVAGIIKDYINPDIVICSDLKRAYNTAIPIANVFGKEPIKFEGLREVYNGDWEGVPYEEVKKKYPDEFERWLNGDKDFAFPSGENYYQLYERSRKVFDEQLAKCDSMILVAHYGTIECLLSGIFFGQPVSKSLFVPKNSSIIRFEYDGDRALLTDFNV